MLTGRVKHLKLRFALAPRCGWHGFRDILLREPALQ